MGRPAPVTAKWLPDNATRRQVFDATVVVLRGFGWNVYTSEERPYTAIAARKRPRDEGPRSQVMYLVAASCPRLSAEDQAWVESVKSTYWGLDLFIVCPGSFEGFVNWAVDPDTDQFKATMTMAVSRARVRERTRRRAR